MKKLLAVIFIWSTVLSYCKAQTSANDTFSPLHTYEISYSKDQKVFKGLLKRADIENDTAFKWFQHNYKLGTPDVSAVDAFKKHVNDFQMVVFLGTWCDDTQNLLPQFFRVADAAGYAEDNITLIGVDRPKTTLADLHGAFHIVEVPTFIVMKGGKEVGRVVEYGESGEAMKELGKIVAGL
jgi:thiol-disulfide isomerase/thioredoxin